MFLDKTQTYNHLLSSIKQQSILSRYKVSTKFKWNCLSCLQPIYIRFNTYSLATIFCKDCFKRHRSSPTIAQYQYLHRLKTEQLKFLETFMNEMLSQTKNDSEPNNEQ